MNDLISRKTVIDLINKRIAERKPDGNSIWLRNDEAIDIQAAIEELPTAYDVDKVINRIANDKEHTVYGCINKYEVIEIIKEGAVKDE